MSDSSDKPSAFERFENFARAIVRVPKKEVAALQRPPKKRKAKSQVKQPQKA